MNINHSISLKDLILIFLFPLSISAFGQSQLFEVDSSYLSKHDIVYKSPSYEGFEGFPIGNGDLGGLIWATPNGIKLQINKSDAFDGKNKESPANLRSCGQLDIDFSAPCFDWLYLNDFDGRLSLYDGKVSFLSETPFSKITINSVVAVNKNVWLIECEKNEKGDLLGKTSVKVGLERWGSRSFASWYSRYNHNPEIGIGQAKAGIDKDVIYFTEQFDKLNFAVACKITGLKTEAEIINKHRAELKTERFSSGKIYIMVAVATSAETENPLQTARNLLEETGNQIKETLKEHQEWWHSFWQRSFVHLPDDYIENIYYFKRYVLACSSSGMYPALFNSAIFTWNHDVRNWVTPHHWNMQQIYWGILPSGDADLLVPYLDAYDRIVPQAEEYASKRGAENAILITEPHSFDGNMVGAEWSNMANNFTPASQIAGFFWEYYKYTGDISYLKEKGFPFMKKTASFYLQKLQWDKDKSEYFLFPAQPYEHERARELKNCITDRVMIESLFRNCINAAEILETDRDLIKQWKQVVDNLWAPPMAPAHFFKGTEWPGYNPVTAVESKFSDQEMFALGYKPDGTVYPDSTEAGDWVYHFSANTAAVFPANLIGIDQKGSPWFNACATAVKMHPHYRNAITPDPIVAARLGMGDESLKMIGNSIRRLQHFPQGMFYNLDHWFWFSRYADSLKTPEYSAMRDYIYDKRAHYNVKGNLSGLPAEPFVQFGLEPLGSIGAAINEMLLQSVGGKIRVFPAIPKEWDNREIAFKLWAENGFLVSAMKNTEAEIEPFSIKSFQGNDCVFVNPWQGEKCNIKSSSGKKIKCKEIGEAMFSFHTSAGEDYFISPVELQENKEIKVFKGIKNNGPRFFQEAILGKERDF